MPWGKVVRSLLLINETGLANPLHCVTGFRDVAHDLPCRDFVLQTSDRESRGIACLTALVGGADCPAIPNSGVETPAEAPSEHGFNP